jgi:hypothetical protein
MSRSFLTPIDLNKLEIRQAVAQVLGTAPSSPATGQFYYDSSSNYILTYNGSTWVDARARSSHSGTQTASTISDFDTQVRTSRLDQMAAPTADVSMNAHKLTGLAAPTSANDAATYSYVNTQVQGAMAGISSKDPVRAVATSNVSSLSGTTTIDGVSLVATDRVLLTAQTTASQNGVWNVASGSWTRPVTEGGTAELDFGAMWLVLGGSVNAGTQWRLSSPVSGTITPGSTSITITQWGVATAYTAGDGLTLTGSAFSVVADSGISVSGSGVAIDTAVVARKYSTTIGDGSATSFTVTHGLSTQDIVVMVRQAGSPYGVVDCDVAAASTSTATVAFAAAPSTNQYRVTVIG